MSEIIRHYAEEFGGGGNVLIGDAESLLDAMILETDENLLSELFVAWNNKGIHEDEIFSLAKIMRSRAIKVRSRHERFVDIVGTGGSKAKTFNVSTAAAFVVAGAGVPVAKHGNKAATSNSGSADVLGALGIAIASPEEAERNLNEFGICFMFAPNHHRLSPTLAKVRRGLGFPTIFNCVGPLCNPADPPHQLIGVWSEEMLPKMANTMARLGTKRSWVVHGLDGLDEISLARETSVAEVCGDKVSDFEHSPVGLLSTIDINVADSSESAKLVTGVLANQLQESAAEKLVIENAAAAILITADVTMDAAKLRATESIRNGNALSLLERLRKEPTV